MVLTRHLLPPWRLHVGISRSQTLQVQKRTSEFPPELYPPILVHGPTTQPVAEVKGLKIVLYYLHNAPNSFPGLPVTPLLCHLSFSPAYSCHQGQSRAVPLVCIHLPHLCITLFSLLFMSHLHLLQEIFPHQNKICLFHLILPSGLSYAPWILHDIILFWFFWQHSALPKLCFVFTCFAVNFQSPLLEYKFHESKDLLSSVDYCISNT